MREQRDHVRNYTGLLTTTVAKLVHLGLVALRVRAAQKRGNKDQLGLEARACVLWIFFVAMHFARAQEERASPGTLLRHLHRKAAPPPSPPSAPSRRHTHSTELLLAPCVCVVRARCVPVLCARGACVGACVCVPILMQVLQRAMRPTPAQQQSTTAPLLALRLGAGFLRDFLGISRYNPLKPQREP